MSSELLSRDDTIRECVFTEPAEIVAAYFDCERGFRTPQLDAWGRRFAQLKEIDTTHQKYDDVETPRIPFNIIQGARRLIRVLEGQGVPPPTCMTGTVDATICFEWHNWNDTGRSMTIDVLGYDQIERFSYTNDGKPQIAIEGF